MANTLTLATQKPFGTLTCDFYKGDNNEFYMTREQIGTALEYAKPNEAIYQIHNRNADRLNPLSTLLKTKRVEGKRTVERETFVYTLRGAMEICRFSRQPKADKFMDFVWDVMESLYAGRNVLATPDQQSAVAPQTMQLLVDAMLKTQLETARCMLSMTNTMSAMADRILGGTAQPAEASAKTDPASAADTPQNESDSVIVAEPIVAEPVPESPGKPVLHRKTTSEWCQVAYDKVEAIRSLQPDQWATNTSVLSYIYKKMRDNYGFVVDAERQQYMSTHPYATKVAVITLIQANTTWSEIFDNILDDLYNAAIIENARRQESEQKLAAALRKREASKLLTSEMDSDPKSIAAVAAEDAEAARKLVQENAVKIRGAAHTLAERICDSSAHKNYSYQLIYRKMNCDWDKFTQSFKNQFRRNPISKIDIISHSEKLTQLFIASYDEIVHEKRMK